MKLGDFTDTQWPSEESENSADPADSAFARIARTYVTARVALGVALLATVLGVHLSGSHSTPWPVLITGVYAAIAALGLVWERRIQRLVPSRHGREQRYGLAIGLDILAFAALQLTEAAPNLNFAALLALPVLMAGVLLPRRLAIGTAAGVSIVLLVLAGRASLAASSGLALMAPTGLAGIGLFLVAWLAGELASRLVREQQRAQGSMALARQQTRLNRLMIDGMTEGVLVVDRRLQVQAANPAARRLLGMNDAPWVLPFSLSAHPAWAGLKDAVERGFMEMRWPEGGRDLTLAAPVPQELRVRMRFTQPSIPGVAEVAAGAGTDFCLMLVEETRAAQARVQQEKLAAMGRVSAGIAHEIRNPLAAIAQANALWSEDELPPAQRRLAGIVADNVARLQRIVDDVLQAIPTNAGDPLPVDAVDALRRGVQAWAAATGVAADRVQVAAPGGVVKVFFDPEHLRRVLVNLLDNAHRHAKTGSGAVRVTLSEVSPQEASVCVSNDGPLIAPEVQAHLFEPFFSTASRGSGLGLYICRELCERYGARIEYRHIESTGTGPRRAWPSFVLTLRRPA